MVIVTTAAPAVPGLVAPQVGGGRPAELPHLLLRPLPGGLNGTLAEILVSLGEVLVVLRFDVRRDLASRGGEVAPVLLVLVVAAGLHGLVGAGARTGSSTLGCDGWQAVFTSIIATTLTLTNTASARLALHRVVLLLGVAGAGRILPSDLHPGVAGAVGVERGAVHAVVHVVQRGVEVGHHLGVSSRESRYNSFHIKTVTVYCYD